ncbi:MAG: CHASE4 domain-containing protein, partial [Treponemataceae bacterium]
MLKSGKLSAQFTGLILTLSAGTALLIIGVLVATTATSFLEIERKTVKAGLDRVEATLNSQLEGIESKTADYAVWDDTYKYIQGKIPSYASENMNGSVLRNLGLSFGAIYDENGTLIAADASSGKNVPKNLPKSLNATSPVFSPTTRANERRTGLTRIDDQVYALTAMAALRSDGNGPSKGLVVFAREIDDSFAASTSKMTGLKVNFMPVAEQGLPALREIETGGLHEPVIGKRILNDVVGKPTILAITSEPRTIFNLGHRAILMLIVSTAVILLFGAIVLQNVFASLLIKPMKRLETFITKGHSSDDSFDGELIALGQRSDAVGRTARVIKAARDEMSKMLDLQRNANEQLEIEVRTRTNELTKANREMAIYQRVMEETSEGVIITDIEGNIREANKAFCDMSGYDLSELINKNPRILKSDKHDDAFFTSMWEAILSVGCWEGEVWNKRKNGSLFPIWLNIDTISDENGKPSRFVGISADISKIKKAEENLNRMAFYDPLTDLPNRALFKDRFKQALARSQRIGNRVALLYLDLDRFKNVNDSLGHHAGDELLKESAKRIKSQVRDADTVCRLGG